MKPRNLLPKRQRRRRKNRIHCRECSTRCQRAARLERLEERQLLTGSNLFSQFSGILEPGGTETQRLDVAVAPEALSMTRDRAILGFRLKGGLAGDFDPSVIDVADADGAPVERLFAR
jgi:hypothetical protein